MSTLPASVHTALLTQPPWVVVFAMVFVIAIALQSMRLAFSFARDATAAIIFFAAGPAVVAAVAAAVAHYVRMDTVAVAREWVRACMAWAGLTW